MVVRTRPPQTPVMPRSVAISPRRWPRRLAVGLVVVLVGATLGAQLYLRSYAPLAVGSGRYGVTPERLVVDRFTAEGSADGRFDQYYMRWARGATVHMAFPLWNEGPLPVTIDGTARTLPEPKDMLSVTLVGTGPVEGAGAGQMTDTPFASFTLEPGRGVQMFVDVTMNRPLDADTYMGVNMIELTYRAGWIPHDISLFMGESLVLCGGGACPP
ncbi:MAG: hypothetical protein ABJB55_00420 [Actinomycetota bacterium]